MNIRLLVCHFFVQNDGPNHLILEVTMRKCMFKLTTAFCFLAPTLAQGDTFEWDETEGVAPPVKVAICHFQEEAGTWKLMNLPEKPASRHLEKHDDAVPGGVTTLTGTQLDETCAAAAPA